MDVGLVILAASTLCVGAILAGAAGQKVDAPFLLVFLLVGMLAGREGPGGISIDATQTTIVWASAALAAILFEGGLRTKPRVFQLGARSGMALALFGTVATALIVAPVAKWLLGVSWGEALLIGAVVSATDAAAVFALAATGLKMPPRVVAALEVESGNNDPIAILLVLGLTASLVGAPLGVGGWALLLIQKLGVGALVGIGVGWVAPAIIDRTRLPTGLMSILAAGIGFLAFGLAETIGGSGFLAIYLAGLTLGARAPHAAERAGAIMDGLAWLAQTGLFLILGLLVTPSHLASVAPPALGIALALIFVARPLAVAASLAPFRFKTREMGFIAWTGLRGATPVFLGLLPAALGAPNGNLYLSVGAVVVLLSLVIQGWTAPVVGRALNISGDDEPPVDRGETLARLGAVASAIAVGAWFAVSLTPPAAFVKIAPDDVEGLRRTLESEFEAASSFPPGFSNLDDAERRPLFAAALADVMAEANAAVETDRALLSALAQKRARAGRLSLAEEADIDALARRYGLDFDLPDRLLERIDVVPVRLAAAQAVLATGWGGSARAVEANAVFGIGLAEGYPDLQSAADVLISFYAGHRDFDTLRAARAALRAEGQALTAEALAPHLKPFAADGETYVSQLTAVLATPALQAAIDGVSPPERSP